MAENDPTQTVPQESQTDRIEPDNIPRIEPKRSLSTVWLVPFATIIIAAYLGYTAWVEKGPTIEITFQQASGITVNKTQIRYRDVKIGVVKDIRFGQGLDDVHVTAELDPEIEQYLTVNSLFWVVSPQISFSGVSGLSTLLSGVYIEFDPGEEGEFTSKFIGLEEAPAIRSYAKGTTFHLISDDLTSLTASSPVYYRKMPVGEVSNFRLTEDLNGMKIRLFIEAPFDRLVAENSNFWNTSGLSFTLDSEGFQVGIESVVSLLSGGIAFDRPTGDDFKPAKPNQTFYLYKDKEAVLEGAYRINYPYVLRFSGSVRGLNEGAPVELQGIHIGRVNKIEMAIDDQSENNIYVYIDIQPERMNSEQVLSQEQLNDNLQRLVQNGMRAQLKTGSFLTGGLYVDLVVSSSEERGELTYVDGTIEIPTMGNQFELIATKAGSIVSKIDQIPFDKIGKNLADIMLAVKDISVDLNDNNFGDEVGGLAKNLNQASTKLEAVLEAANITLQQLDDSLAVIEPDTPLYHSTMKMVKDISEAAESLEALTDELARNPQSLIYGSKNPE